MSNRYSPHVNYTEWSPNKSSRGGAHPTLIVIHATVSHNVQGLGDLKAIGEWFSRPSTQASSHVCTDNEGHSARYVRDGEKAWHCFGADEEFLTAEGRRTFGETVGTTQMVLTSQGLALAEIEPFGDQPVQRVTFAPAHRRSHWRNGAAYWSPAASRVRRHVTVTPDHEWILADGGTTRELAIGDTIAGCVREPDVESLEYATGVRDGFVFADGYRQATEKHHMRFAAPMHGKKDWVAPYFDRVAHWPSRAKREPTYRATGLCNSQRDLKRAPVDVEDCDYLAGWVRGWLAGDGSKCPDGSYWLSSTDEEALRFVADFAPLAGYTVLGSNEMRPRHTTYGHTRIGGVRLREGASGWKVQSIEPMEEEPVYCAVVPDTQDFTLAGGLLTHNCAGYNRMSLGVEQILPATGAEVTRDLYRETARWVARWSKMYGIPIRKGTVSNGSVTRAGVVRHSELGALGGGHSDPGPYDMDAMLSLARFYRRRI